MHKIIFLTIIFLIINNIHNQKVINFEPKSLTIEVNKSNTVIINLVNRANQTINVNFTYGNENEEYTESKYIKPLDPVKFTPDGNQSYSIRIEAIEVGHLVIGAKSNETEIPFSDIFRLDVIHSDFMNILISVIGWIYFFAWSISFYPQVFLNYKLKDVSGLSFDFISLNFLGHSCYFAFNIALYSIAEVQHEYFKKHPRGVNPVLLNDVLFSAHAVLLTMITIIQVMFYRKSGKTISLIVKILLVGFIAFLSISGVICIFKSLSILTYIYFFSYVKLAITLMKYIPQAYTNFKRKSTVGWSILNVLLDFTGGSLSIMQMFLLAYNYNDWSSIFGSPTKLGLGLFSIFFDVLFMVQHYCLYNTRTHVNLNSEDSYTPIS